MERPLHGIDRVLSTAAAKVHPVRVVEVVQILHPLVALVVTQLCQGKGMGLLLPWAGGWHGAAGLCLTEPPPRAAPPAPPGTCEDVGQEPGDEVLLILGQGLWPCPPDQAAWGPGGIPPSAWGLCCGPAQAGGGCDGEDEADANLHLHGCGETEREREAEGQWPWDRGHMLSLWRGVTHAGSSSPGHGQFTNPLCPSQRVPQPPPSLLAGPQVFSIPISWLVPRSRRMDSSWKGAVRIEPNSLCLTGLPKIKPYDQECCPELLEHCQAGSRCSSLELGRSPHPLHPSPLVPTSIPLPSPPGLTCWLRAQRCLNPGLSSAFKGTAATAPPWGGSEPTRRALGCTDRWTHMEGVCVYTHICTCVCIYLYGHYRR